MFTLFVHSTASNERRTERPTLSCEPSRLEKMSWLKDSQVLEKWKTCAGKGAEADAAAFADASLALISVFDLISGMGIASSDMRGNALTIQNAAQAAPGETLASLVNAETADKDAGTLGKLAGDGKTVSCALLWLGRALNFILKMLSVMMAEPTKKMSDCVYAGYEVSLRPHHGMIIRGTFSVAVKAAPNRDTFIAKLGPSEAEVFGLIGAEMKDMEELVGAISAFLMSKDAKVFAP